MNRILLSTGLVALTVLGLDHLVELRSRLRELERSPRVEPELVRELAREINALRRDLDRARETLADGASVEQIEGKLAVVASTLETERCRVAEHGERIEDWETRWSGHAPEAIDGRLRELHSDLAARQAELEDLRKSNSQLVEEDRARYYQLESRVEPLLQSHDSGRMWQELVGPVVQLAGDTTVGSGVLLQSRPRQDGSGWVTHLLTSWHVVRDIYGTTDRISEPVPVRMYEPDGSSRDERARMVAYDVPLDLALLEMDLNVRIPYGAHLAPRAKLASVSVFDPIYAVGCPLGNDPIPTLGEVAATHHVVDNQVYWMVSAQTYIGNSGGGIFDARTHELIGIFSKIYTHGSTRTTIVPHMGLATPLPVVYEWLERAGCVAMVDAPPADGGLQTASAQR